MPPQDEILSLAEPFEFELDPIKGSRFLACLAPCGTEEEAKAFLASVRERFRDARADFDDWTVEKPTLLEGVATERERSSAALGRPVYRCLFTATGESSS